MEGGANPRKQMRETKDGGWKRKKSTIGRDESIYFLFNSAHSMKCAALFELKITITGDKIVSRHSYDLQRLETFYPQCIANDISYALCAPLTKGRYLIIPNEFGGFKPIPIREKSCIYHSVERFTSTVDKLPLGAKSNPIAVTVGDKVYVLSRRTVAQFAFSEPSFEAYDPIKKDWEALEAPFFNQNIPCMHRWILTGYAVFGEFIIVCLYNRLCRNEHDIYSYNTISLEWKRVCYTTPPVVVYDDGTCVFDDTNDMCGYSYDFEEDTYAFIRVRRPSLHYLLWCEEAVVFDHFIYAFVEELGMLVSYDCTKAKSLENGSDILSFCEKIVLVRLEHHPVGWDWDWSKGMITGTVGKIGPDLICVVKTFCPRDVSAVQPVHLTILRILEDGGRCCSLQSFDLTMKGDELFRSANILSCFLWQPEGVSNSHHGERTPKKASLSYKV